MVPRLNGRLLAEITVTPRRPFLITKTIEFLDLFFEWRRSANNLQLGIIVPGNIMSSQSPFVLLSSL